MAGSEPQQTIGCDGDCRNSEDQESYFLDDMEVAFCKQCWTKEMNRRRRSGRGEIIPFPGIVSAIGEMRVVTASLARSYTHLDEARFEKIARRGKSGLVDDYKI